MFQNNNNAVIRQLTKSSISSSKLRNLFIILTVFLSVTLLSVISMLTSAIHEKENISLKTVQHVIYSELDQKQIDGLKTDEEVSFILFSKTGKSVEINGRMLRMFYCDPSDGQIQTYELSEGREPQSKYEVAADKTFLEDCGIPAEIGQSLEVTFLDGVTEKFTVTGFYKTQGKSNLCNLICTKEYAETGAELENIKYDAFVKINNANSYSEEEFLSRTKELGKKYGIPMQNCNTNNYFAGNLSMSSTETLIVVLVSVGILLISVLVIYSVFYISINSKIKEFGQLRTLGMTKKQVKKMVTNESILLCLIGCPPGIIIGILSVLIFIPEGFNIINILILAVLIILADILTVLISVHKPAKFASSVSPIEASKYSSYSENNSKESKKLNRKLTPFSLAVISSNRNLKKSVMTIISLAVGGILFIVGATFVQSMNREEFSRQGIYEKGEFIISFDHNTVETAEHGLYDIQKNNPLNDELISELKAVDGVKDVFKAGSFPVSWQYKGINQRNDFITGFTQDEANRISKLLKEGSIDYDEMIENNEVIIELNNVVNEIFGWKFQVGDTVTISYYNGTEYVNKDFKIAAVSEKNFESNNSYVSGWFHIPEEKLNEISGGMNLNRRLAVSVENYDPDDLDTENQIAAIVEKNPLLSLDTLRQRLANDEMSYITLCGVVYAMAIFIIGFSLINMINTIISNIISRKNEFAMLQSIGMSEKQLRSTMITEGMLLAVYNTILSLIFGTVFGYWLIYLMRESDVKYMHYHFPLTLSIIYIIITFLVPIIISSFFIRYFKKSSLVERLRETE